MGLTMTCGVDPVLMNPPKLQCVLYNLFSHALRHTPADDTFALHAEPDGEVVWIEVAPRESAPPRKTCCTSSSARFGERCGEVTEERTALPPAPGWGSP